MTGKQEPLLKIIPGFPARLWNESPVAAEETNPHRTMLNPSGLAYTVYLIHGEVI